jgi:Transposase, Mutator family
MGATVGATSANKHGWPRSSVEVKVLVSRLFLDHSGQRWTRHTASVRERVDAREISAHLMDVYGASVSKDTASRITDKIVEEMPTWWSWPLETVYAAQVLGPDLVGPTPPPRSLWPSRLDTTSSAAGTGLPRDPQPADARLDRVRPVPGLRPRDPPGPLLSGRTAAQTVFQIVPT